MGRRDKVATMERPPCRRREGVFIEVHTIPITRSGRRAVEFPAHSTGDGSWHIARPLPPSRLEPIARRGGAPNA